jgi:hypothetical protein
MRASCGDGVIDAGEECDVGDANANSGCSQCMRCYKPEDNLYITNDARLCPGDYQIRDEGEEGVIIISGSDITVDCDGALLKGADVNSIPQAVVGADLTQVTPTTQATSSTLRSSGQHGTALSGGGLTMTSIASSTTVKVTSTTFKATTTTVEVVPTTLLVLTHQMSKTTTTTQETTTTVKVSLPFTHMRPIQTTTTTLMTVAKFFKTLLFASPNTVVLAYGTGIRVTGNNVLLLNCGVSNYRTGVKLQGTGNVLARNRLCGNTQDINSGGCNYGTVNHCDRSANWFENGVAGCTYLCDGSSNSGCGEQAQQQQPQDSGGGEEGAEPGQEEQQQGLLGRIFGLIFRK